MRVTLSIALLLLAGCDRPQWQGWIYPDKTDLTRSIEIGPYKTLDACRVAVLRATRNMIDPYGWDYECGFRCKPDPRLGINVCARVPRLGLRTV